MLSVVAPVFNELESLDELHQRLTAVLVPFAEYEIVLVDDGSHDGSWDRLMVLSAQDPHLRLIRLSRNFGHQAALSAGLDAAHGEIVVLMDADLQDPPEVIPQLVAKWREGFDIVYAIRTAREGERAWRRLAIKSFYRVFRRIAATDIPEDTGDFRLLSRRAADALIAMPERALYLRGMTSWIGFRQIGVPYERQARFAGESKYPLGKLIRLATDGITSFSSAPIKAVSALGFAMIVFCMGVLAWSLEERFSGSRVPQGWTSVIVVVLLLGGVQLLSIGIIGQYVARIFEETKQRPRYIVDAIVEPRVEPPTVQSADAMVTPS
jgi:glycosyltransferase involved in cell wall biosynthesis